jgi:hypothetical protein
MKYIFLSGHTSAKENKNHTSLILSYCWISEKLSYYGGKLTRYFEVTPPCHSEQKIYGTGTVLRKEDSA